MTTTSPKEQTLLQQAEAAAQLALTLDVVVGQMLFDHNHALVLNALLGAYVKQVIRCPGCTEEASRVLPELGGQLKAIAAATTKPADKPLH
jgi:hypothetical protein